MKLTIFKDKSPVPRDNRAVARKQEFVRKVAAIRAATGKAERFATACACAIHDKPFSVLYERTDPEKPFTIAGIYKNEDGNSAGTIDRRPRTLAAHEVDETGWRCPWCGDISIVMQCPDCRTTVCGGRVTRAPGAQPVFTCRPSCGARCTMMKAETVTGSEGRHRRSGPPFRPALPQESGRLLLGKKK